jgi:hypothetical protein
MIGAMALIMVGCGAGQAEFTPAERAVARSPEGYQAAEYQIGSKDGIVGTARVWSMGTAQRLVQGQEREVLQIAFQIENHTSRPLSMNTDDLRLDLGVMDKRIIDGVEPVFTSGSLTIEPGKTQRVDVYFALPADVRPQHINAFQVKWKLTSRGLSYSQKTPFVESQTERYVYYYTPFYDPFLYDYYLYHPRIIVHRSPYRHYHVYR